MAVTQRFQDVVASRPYVVIDESSVDKLELIGCELVAAGYDPQGGAVAYADQDGTIRWHQTFLRIMREKDERHTHP
jgi:hypothetical protein